MEIFRKVDVTKNLNILNKFDKNLKMGSKNFNFEF